MNKVIFLVGLFLTAAISAAAQVANNPPYTLEQSVIASGGGTSTDAGNIYSVTGTIGQPVTDTSSGLPYTIKSGFFTSSPLSPTASMVTVSGRVTTAAGRGIRNVIIFMTDGQGTLRTASSSSFGFFRFTDVPAGETYIFTAKAKRFQFSQPTQALSVLDDVTDLNFVANLN